MTSIYNNIDCKDCKYYKWLPNFKLYCNKYQYIFNYIYPKECIHYLKFPAL